MMQSVHHENDWETRKQHLGLHFFIRRKLPLVQLSND